MPMAGAEPKPTVAQVEARVNALQEQVAATSEQYNETREDLATRRVRVAAAKAREAQQKAAIVEIRRDLGRLAAELYRKGDLAELEFYLSDEPEAVLGRMGLASSLGERRENLATRLETGQRQLAADTAAVIQQEQRVAAAEANLKVKKAEIERTLAAADAQLGQLREEERQELQRIARAREQAEIQKALAEAAAQEKAEQATQEETEPEQEDEEDSSDGSSGSSGSGSSSGSTVSCGGRSVKAPTARVVKVLKYACGQIGEPYSWGADGPGSWDCSGLTLMAWRQAGVSLPHSSRMQIGYGNRVSRSDLQAGDLVFFNSPISHVGIYIGAGLMVHAPKPGRNVGVAALISNYAGAVRL
jgi:cell wall-associated NlpC family hydrolase